MFRDQETFKEVTLSDLSKVAGEALKLAGNIKVWTFEGEMGAGKTTFIKELCHNVGVIDTMSSPTFSIVNEYLTKNSGKVFHFDFFRLKREEEAYDIGAEDYFYSGAYCFVEWPDKVPTLIPAEHVHVRITSDSDIFRTIAISVHDGKEKNRI